MIQNILPKALVAAVCISSVLSCGSKAGFSGTLKDAPEKKVVVKLLDVNKYKVLDTLTTDKQGNFSGKVEVVAGQPEFVHLFSGDTKIASLLLQKGDRVKIVADTLGDYTVSGSEDAEKLAQFDKSFSDFMKDYVAKSNAIAALPEGSDQAKALTRELVKSYLGYHRDRSKFVVTNSKSLAVVPVLFQNIGDTPLFNQPAEAMLFVNAADSLETVYPESKYVKALRKEAELRTNILGLTAKINAAPVVGIMDIELPDITGKNVKLSDVDSKMTMVCFWAPGDERQKMYNLDMLKSLYTDYHAKGFQIYQVAFTLDKADWASTIKGQGLDWVNVCDSRASASPYISLFNIPALPFILFEYEGDLVQESFTTDEKSLRKLIEKYLK